jgi:hypothetical protein
LFTGASFGSTNISCLSGGRRFQQVITSEGRPALKRLAPDCPQFYGEGSLFAADPSCELTYLGCPFA